MVLSLLRTDLNFFLTNSVERILSKFTVNLHSLDTKLLPSVLDSLEGIMMYSYLLIISISIMPYFAIPATINLLIIYHWSRYCTPAINETMSCNRLQRNALI